MATVYRRNTDLVGDSRVSDIHLVLPKYLFCSRRPRGQFGRSGEQKESKSPQLIETVEHEPPLPVTPIVTFARA